MKYYEVLEEGKKILKKENISESDNDAWLLMEHVFEITRSKYFINQKEEADKLLTQKYFEAISKRAEHYPLQYILGKWYFMGMEFLVNENVLIPRQDTECLVEKVIEIAKKNYAGKTIKILDMCTGSGCIAVSLCKLIDNCCVTAVDLSEQALETAQKNAKLNICLDDEEIDSRIKFINSDLYAELPQGDKFDIIVSNPPYIPTKIIEGLMEEVRMYEPAMALDGSEDGLAFYRRITENSNLYLKSGGFLAYEIGCEQGMEVSGIMIRNNFEDIEVIKDLCGLDRVVCGKLA